MKKIDCFVTFCISIFEMVFIGLQTRQENECGILNDVNVVDSSYSIYFLHELNRKLISFQQMCLYAYIFM